MIEGLEELRLNKPKKQICIYCYKDLKGKSKMVLSGRYTFCPKCFEEYYLKSLVIEVL